MLDGNKAAAVVGRATFCIVDEPARHIPGVAAGGSRRRAIDAAAAELRSGKAVRVAPQCGW